MVTHTPTATVQNPLRFLVLLAQMASAGKSQTTACPAPTTASEAAVSATPTAER